VVFENRSQQAFKDLIPFRRACYFLIKKPGLLMGSSYEKLYSVNASSVLYILKSVCGTPAPKTPVYQAS